MHIYGIELMELLWNSRYSRTIEHWTQSIKSIRFCLWKRNSVRLSQDEAGRSNDYVIAQERRLNVSAIGSVRYIFPDFDLVLHNTAYSRTTARCPATTPRRNFSRPTLSVALPERLIELQRRISPGSDWIFPTAV